MGGLIHLLAIYSVKWYNLPYENLVAKI